MVFTIFHTKSLIKKFPESPYDDSTFVFENIEVESNFQAYQLLVNNFVLNIPNNTNKLIRCQRQKKFLKEVSSNNFNYILFDFDCDSEFKQNQVLKYFANINCIIGKSRSHNNIDNFNLKGIIRTELLNINELKIIQAQLQSDLKDYGYYNDDVLRITYFTAPILNSSILFNNEEGLILKKQDKKLIDFYAKAPRTSLNISSSNTLEICQAIFKNLGFIQKGVNSDNSIKYEKDNDSNYFWYNDNPYIMFNKNKLKTLNIWDEAKKYENNDLNIEEYFDYKADEFYDIFEKNNQLDLIIEKFLFSKNGCLTLKSFMGSGKTNFIKTIVDKAHDRDFKVMIITNRVTLADDFANKFNIKKYYENNYEIGDSLICQFDSLWKYDISFFDIFIMDEFVSLLLHSRNNLSSNISNMTKLYSILNKKIIISDAFLNNYIFNLIDNKNIFNLIYKNKDDIKLFEAPNKSTLFSLIYNAAKNKDKFSISCSSLSLIDEIKDFLKQFNLKILTFTANIDSKRRELIYKEFEKQEPIYDVLIYSPVVSSGISIYNKFKYHFHLDNAMSIDVISSLQMLRRLRKCETIIYYVAQRCEFTCVNYNTLRTKLLENPSSKDKDLFTINDYGELGLSKVGQIGLKIDIFLNILKRNYKKSFDYFLRMNFSNEPILLKNIELVK